MKEFIENLPDGWTIYVWIIVAAGILITAVYMLRWAAKNSQFDEDIKYVVFSKDDEDHMAPEEFAKSREVIAKQEQLRAEYLEQQSKARAAKHASR
jgi:nitrogen fixation-related uncharacterized protein